MNNILSEINKAVLKDETAFMAKCEAEYLEKVNKVADAIINDGNKKIILIAGPSASGKTTTSKILKNILMQRGLNAETVSLDDFYLEPEKSPVLPDGSRDFESVNALDINEMRFCFNELVTKGKTTLPVFDFIKREKHHNVRPIDITNGLLIAEGLHALNPVIYENLPKENLLKVYISVSEPILNDDGTTLLSSKKIRLIRRIIRDIKFRDVDVEATLTLWNNVIAEETRSLYKYKDTADIVLATLHPYELCVYKDLLDEVDLSVSTAAPNYGYYMQTVDGLMRFEEIDDVNVPYNSLIREFIGNGKYN